MKEDDLLKTLQYSMFKTRFTNPIATPSSEKLRKPNSLFSLSLRSTLHIQTLAPISTPQ